MHVRVPHDDDTRRQIADHTCDEDDDVDDAQRHGLRHTPVPGAQVGLIRLPGWRPDNSSAKVIRLHGAQV